MSCIEVLAIVKEIVVTLAAAATADIAYRGLETWRNQLKGTADFDIANSIAQSTYNLRDAMDGCRSALFLDFEFPQDWNSIAAHKANDHENGNIYAHIFNNRWDPVQKALHEFDSCVLQAEALWGAELREKTDNLKKCAIRLQVSTEAYVANKFAGGRNFESDADFEKQIVSDVIPI